MSKHQWFVYLSGETLGPLSIDNITLMLKQNRLQFADYVWASPMKKWQRIIELEPFSKLAPAYPKIPIPKVSAEEPDYPKAPTPKVQAGKPAPSYVVEQPAVVTPPPAPASAPEGKKGSQGWSKIRKFLRLENHGEKVRLAGHGEYPVLNISVGGIFLKSENPLEVGTDIKLNLHLPGHPKELEMTGVVIRHGVVDKQTGFAVEFTRMNPAHKRALHEHITKWAEAK